MPAYLELVVDLSQFRPHPLRDGDTPQPEPSLPGLPAQVREAQEVERLRFALSPRGPGPGGAEPVNMYETAVRTIYWVELA